MATWTVHAAFDSDSRSWYTTDTDVPGLVTGATTLDEMMAKLPSMIAEMLELNAHRVPSDAVAGGVVRFRLISNHPVEELVAA